MHELVPETPLRHGHAISIDMAYSATLANNRKLISDAEHRRILNLFSRAGLAMDHHLFDEEILDKGTAAILKTRDGKLRAAVPNPIGTCTFLNDVQADELNAALRRHKELMKEYPRNGEGIEAYVDASDTGYTETIAPELDALETAAEEAGKLNENGTIHGGNVANVLSNGHTNGESNGHVNGHINGVNGIKDKLTQGLSDGIPNGVNSLTNRSGA
jgi:3-dehydroquinate synthase